jgi:hypothetical protein
LHAAATTDESSPRRVGFALVGLFAAIAVATLLSWTISDHNQVTGDEPHYLVLADSLVSHRSLEVTDAYRDEFRTQDIYSPGLAGVGADPVPENSHSVESDRGLFSVHAIGLPALVSLPFAIGGTLLAKLFLIAISSVAVWLNWRASDRFEGSRRDRAAAVAVVMTGMGFVTAATQVYPDATIGVLALFAITVILRYEAAVASDPTPTAPAPCTGLRRPWVATSVLAVLPLLHIKTIATAAVLTLTIAALDWRRQRSPRRAAAIVAPLVIVGVLVAVYNAWAFGRLGGPYEGGNLTLGRMPATVLFGLYTDQFHGMFVQNPALLAALVALPMFVRRFPVTGLAVIVTHLSFVIPNAMHVNWYGGFSLAGRFGVAGALVLTPVAVYGLAHLLANRRTVWPWVLVAILIAFQALQFVRYTVLERSLYNNPLVFPEVYPSQIPVLRSFLPILYRSEWSLRYLPNLAMLMVCVVLLGIGVVLAVHRDRPLRIAVTPIVIVGCLLAIAIAGISAGDQLTDIRVPGRKLPTANADHDDDGAVATGPGLATFGPYVVVGSGPHQFEVTYRSGASELPAGSWDIVAVGVDEPLAGGELDATGTISRSGIEIDIPDELFGKTFEMRTYSSGSTSLEIIDISIRNVVATDQG